MALIISFERRLAHQITFFLRHLLYIMFSSTCCILYEFDSKSVYLSQRVSFRKGSLLAALFKDESGLNIKDCRRSFVPGYTTP